MKVFSKKQSMYQVSAIGRLDEFPREVIGHYPTPIEDMSRLSSYLSVGSLYAKRDDCTGLAFGGNKVRQLEFHFGQARTEGADTVLITGAIQSNYVRTAAAFAAKLGMECHVQLEERVPDVGQIYRSNGNVLLDRLFGAHVYYYDKGEDEAGADLNLQALATRLRDEGRSPYIVPLAPGHTPISALGYVVAAREIVQQCYDSGIQLDEIVVASGSGQTHAGLLFGLCALNSGIRVTGVCVRRSADLQIDRIREKLEDLADLTGHKIKIPDSAIHLQDDYLMPGYGRLNEGTKEALRIGARLEGLVLDPTYTAKTLAGFIDRALQAGRDKCLMFVHTGGTPAVFAYQPELEELL